jgi:hypothetical protein
MLFVFNMFNHNSMGQRSLEDVIGIFGHQLRSLGHECIWDPSNSKFLDQSSGINMIVEGFTPGSIAAIAEAHKNGARFICLATEEPIAGKGFNHGKEREMVERQAVFPYAMPYFEGILHLVPGQHVTDWYGQFKPAAYVELGFAQTLFRKNPKIQPTFDFGFYGSITKRRKKILQQLARKIGTTNAVRVMGDFKSQDERDAAMAEARVIVQIRKYDEMGLVSSSRCNTALMIGRPIIAEPHELSKPWDEVVKFCDTLDEMMSLAVMMRIGWESAWRKQFEKFKALFSPERCVGEPFRQIGWDLSKKLPDVNTAA